MAERVGDDQVADVTLERALRDDDGDGLVPAIGCRRRNSRCSSRRRLSGLFGTGTVKRMVRLVVVLSSFFALIENFALFIERILRALVSLMNEENTLELELLVAPLASSCLYKFVLIFQMKLGKALSSWNSTSLYIRDSLRRFKVFFAFSYRLTNLDNKHIYMFQYKMEKRLKRRIKTGISERLALGIR